MCMISCPQSIHRFSLVGHIAMWSMSSLVPLLHDRQFGSSKVIWRDLVVMALAAELGLIVAGKGLSTRFPSLSSFVTMRLPLALVSLDDALPPLVLCLLAAPGADLSLNVLLEAV